MKKIYNVKSVESAENTPLTAIAAIDRYYAESLNFSPINLKKENHINFISLKKIVKQVDSQPGKFLELKQTIKILSHIGYEADIIHITSEADFRKEIQKNINQNNPIIIFFTAETTGEFAGMPAPYDKNNEVAGLITGFNESTDEVVLSHGGIDYVVPLANLFQGSEKSDGLNLITIKTPKLDDIYNIRKRLFFPLMEKSIENVLLPLSNVLFNEEKIQKKFRESIPLYLAQLSQSIEAGSLLDLEKNIIEAEKILTNTIQSMPISFIKEIMTRGIGNTSKRIFFSYLNHAQTKDSIFVREKKLNLNIHTVKNLEEFKLEQDQQFLLQSYEIYINSTTIITSEVNKLKIDKRYLVNVFFEDISSDFFEQNIFSGLFKLINTNRKNYFFIGMESEKDKIMDFIQQHQEKIGIREVKGIQSKIDSVPGNINFSQTTFYSRYERVLPESCKIYKAKYSGLCQPICLLIAELGIENPKIKQFLEFGNPSTESHYSKNPQYEPDKVKTFSVIKNLDKLCNQVMMLGNEFQAEIKKNNKYLSAITDGKGDLLLEYPGIKRVNIRIMKSVFEKMTYDQFLQLCIIKNDELSHATLIFKTLENEQCLYCFYEPNYGIYKKTTVEELCYAISSTLSDNTTLSIIDVRKFDYLLSLHHENRVEKLKQVLIDHQKSLPCWYRFFSKNETTAVKSILLQLSAKKEAELTTHEFKARFSKPLATKLSPYEDILVRESP